MENWEHFEHGADIGVRGVGQTVEEAFAEAGRALTAVITTIENVACKEWRVIECRGDDMEILFFNWLNALIYEMAVQNMLFCQFSVRIVGDMLHAEVCGESIDVKKHAPAVEIKGATLTALAVYQENGQWIAQCVVDV